MADSWVHIAAPPPGPRLPGAVLLATPLGPLARYVESIWYSEGPLAVLRERVLPSATGDLVLNLGAPMARIDLPGAPRPIHFGTVSGMLLQPMILAHPPIHRAVGARLRPLAGRALLGVPIGEMNDAIVDLETVAGPDGREIEDRCAHERDPEKVVRIFAAWLGARIRRGTPADPIAAWAAGEIERSVAARSSGGIRTLQEKSGYGTTWFIRRFRDEFGITPKTFARIVRFRAALDALSSTVSLAEVAAQTGFADQSHMGAEFRRLAQCTPLEVLARRYPSGFTLAEGDGTKTDPGQK